MSVLSRCRCLVGLRVDCHLCCVVFPEVRPPSLVGRRVELMCIMAARWSDYLGQPLGSCDVFRRRSLSRKSYHRRKSLHNYRSLCCLLKRWRRDIQWANTTLARFEQSCIEDGETGCRLSYQPDPDEEDDDWTAQAVNIAVAVRASLADILSTTRLMIAL